MILDFLTKRSKNIIKVGITVRIKALSFFCFIWILTYSNIAFKNHLQNPVRFNCWVSNKNAQTFQLHIIAYLEKGWHIYAQEQPPNAIAIPTKILFGKNPFIEYLDNPKENGIRETYSDPKGGFSQYEYSDKVEFVQEFEIKRTKIKTNLTYAITYQACTSEMCLPPITMNFSLPVSK